MFYKTVFYFIPFIFTNNNSLYLKAEILKFWSRDSPKCHVITNFLLECHAVLVSHWSLSIEQVTIEICVYFGLFNEEPFFSLAFML